MQAMLQSSLAKAALSIAALGLAVATSGCINAAACDTSDNANPPDVYKGGTTTEDGLYYSSSWHEGLLHFPGGKRYDLVHDLGFEPQSISIWLSFSENGVDDDDQASTVAPSAGNSSVVQLVNDKIIRIKNDTCSEFWVRVTASGKPEAAKP